MKYLTFITILLISSCSNELNKLSFGDFSINIPKDWKVKNNNAIDGFNLVFTKKEDSIFVFSDIDKTLKNFNLAKVDTTNNLVVKCFQEEKYYILYTIVGDMPIQLRANNINSANKLLKIKEIFKTVKFQKATKQVEIINSEFIGNEIYSNDCLYCHGSKDYGMLLTKSLVEISNIRGVINSSKWIVNKGDSLNSNSFLNKNAIYKKCEISKNFTADEVKSLVLYISKNYSGVK